MSEQLLIRRFAVMASNVDDADWEQVVALAANGSIGRARKRPRRALAVVFSALALALLIGGALAATLNGSRFTHWLNGAPGAPASPREQAAFSAANSHSFVSFPATTKLRRLIELRAGGTSYRLYGFRAGDQLCLRLVAAGATGGHALSCIPRRELQSAKASAEVALVDYPFTLHRTAAQAAAGTPPTVAASASFGFVADGVKRVQVVSGSRQNATVAANAFLAVRVRPQPASRIRRIYAFDRAGLRHLVAFAAAPVGWPPRTPGSSRPATGPQQVERHLPRGTIHWLFGHQPRGQSLQAAHIPILSLVGSHWQPVRFARVLTPDPDSSLRIAVSLIGKKGRNICVSTFDPGSEVLGSGGCAVGLLLKPFDVGLSGNGTAFVVFSGLAGDDVAWIDLFLADGERWPVPLSDNAFAVQAPRTEFPVNLVAYDNGGRVIGTSVWRRP
jgi:hypothetical protein